MSSQIVIAPPRLGVGRAVVGAGAVIGGAAQAIRGLVDAMVEAQFRDVQSARAPVAAPRSQDAAPRERAAARARAMSSLLALGKALGAGRPAQQAAVRQVEPATAPARDAETRAAASRTRASVTAMRRLVGAVPPELRAQDPTVWRNLAAEVGRAEARLAGRPGCTTADLERLAANLQRAVREQVARHEAAARNVAEQRDRLRTLLRTIDVWAALATDPPSRTTLAALADDARRLAAAEIVLPGRIDRIAAALESTRQTIEEGLHLRAYRVTLASAIREELEALGYNPVAPATATADATTLAFRMPGGERVVSTIAADGRATFKLCHETAARGKPRAGNLRRYREQEARWCLDFHSVLRGLVARGFGLTVAVAGRLSDEEVPIAVVETADDLLAEDDAQTAVPPGARSMSHGV